MLLIDAGNSAIKLRLYKEGAVSGNWRISWQDSLEQTASMLAEQLLEIDPPSIYLASVASQLQTARIQDVTREVLPARDCHRLLTLPQLGGIRNAYDQPSHLGVDRWLTIMASARVSQKDVIIIDAGSAITVDLVSKQSGHLGGAIMAGFNTTQTRLKSLFPLVDFNSELISQIDKPGHSTAQCLHLETGNDPASYLSELCQRWQSLLDPDFEILTCGQDASRLQGISAAPIRSIPDLVFQGMLQQIEWQG